MQGKETSLYYEKAHAFKLHFNNINIIAYMRNVNTSSIQYIFFNSKTNPELLKLDVKNLIFLQLK